MSPRAILLGACVSFFAGTFPSRGADTASLTGWVSNMEDGSVEMEIQGAPANILSHLEALHASYERMGTRFRLVDAQARAPLANEDGFSPRY